MQTDSLFYRLFQNWPKFAFDLLQLPYEQNSYQFLSEEIKQTGFRIDGIFKPINGNPERPIIFAEVQYQPDPNFYGRFFTEIMLYLYRQTSGPCWLAFVIYPDRKTEKPANPAFQPLLGLPQIKRIYLEDFKLRTEPVYDLLRLVACSPDEAAALVQTLVEKSDKIDKEAIEFIETVLVYKLPKLTREEIKTMLGLDVQLKQTRFYQEIAEEERREGRLEGLLEGRIEGKLEGKHEGECLLLKRQLFKRFGPIPDWARLKLEQAEIEQLELWGDRILDATSLAAVFE